MKNNFWIRNTNYALRITMIIAVIAIISCRSKPEAVEENDVITTVKLTVKDTATGITNNYTFKDLDGEAGNNPVTDTFVLQTNKYYEFTLDFSNERQTPTQSVTAEINANKEEHQIFVTPTPAASLTNF